MSGPSPTAERQKPAIAPTSATPSPGLQSLTVPASTVTRDPSKTGGTTLVAYNAPAEEAQQTTTSTPALKPMTLDEKSRARFFNAAQLDDLPAGATITVWSQKKDENGKWQSTLLGEVKAGVPLDAPGVGHFTLKANPDGTQQATFGAYRGTSAELISYRVSGGDKLEGHMKIEKIGFEVGSTVPKVALTTTDGKEVDLPPELRQGITVLDVSALSWCTHCRTELPQLIGVQKKYEGQTFTVDGKPTNGFRMVGVSSSEEPEVWAESRKQQPWAAHYSLPPTETLGVSALPTLIVLENGVVKAKFVGAKGAEKLREFLEARLESH
ncbi:MAG: TlpA disulfide reductase family protein [Bdellovibrionota bacterium]